MTFPPRLCERISLVESFAGDVLVFTGEVGISMRGKATFCWLVSVCSILMLFARSHRLHRRYTAQILPSFT
jgi:hypothetical protein